VQEEEEEEEEKKTFKARRKVTTVSVGLLESVGGGGAAEEKKRKEMRLHASSSPDRSYKSRNIDLNKEPTAWDDNTDDHASSTSCCTGGGGGGGDSTAPFRGVRHRPELNKWVTEIRPTSQKRKIWLGTYETPQEAARAYDVGIYYTRKKIPFNFPDSPHHLQNQPIPSELPWETFAALVKQKATLAAKRHRVNLQEATPAQ
jgi:hypothetical protein